MGQKIGQYEVGREVGRGGMATVYLARQTVLERDVALKQLAAIHLDDGSFAERFLREARVSSALTHTNIVTVYEYFEQAGVPYIAMEYLSRGSLRPCVTELSLAQSVGVLEGVLAGLSHAERDGIVHRDLKPENLMVTAAGSIKIGDFGIAKAYSRASPGRYLTATGTTIGTPAYMAPEQAMAGRLGPETDLYSTGVIAYEMLVGRLPFDDAAGPVAMLLQHVNDPVPAPRGLRPDLDPQLEDWLLRMLAKSPDDRYATAGEAWDALEDAVITILGPRWRRTARLTATTVEPDNPAPLTPAPFYESPAVATPPPAAASPGVSLPNGGIASEYTTHRDPPPASPTDPTAAEASPPQAVSTPGTPAAAARGEPDVPTTPVRGGEKSRGRAVFAGAAAVGVVVLLVALLAFFLNRGSPADGATIRSGGANVRTGPDIKYRIRWSLAKGTRIHIECKMPNGWDRLGAGHYVWDGRVAHTTTPPPC